MRVIRRIDVLEDPAFQRRVYVVSLAVAAVGLVATVAVCRVTGARDGQVLSLGQWLMSLGATSLAALPVHELVHAAAFKLLCPGCRVSFGAQGAFLYTKTDGAVLPRGGMAVVLLAPAALVTAGLLAGALLAGLPALAVALAALHLSGCAGDVLMARAALTEPACTHVLDTDVGIDLLSDHEEAS